MQLKTQSRCQGGILRGRPCIPHHTPTGPEWWRSPAALRCDVMLTALASLPYLLPFLIPGFLFVLPFWNILTHAHAFRTQLCTDRCSYTRYLERIPHNE